MLSLDTGANELVVSLLLHMLHALFASQVLQRIPHHLTDNCFILSTLPPRTLCLHAASYLRCLTSHSTSQVPCVAPHHATHTQGTKFSPEFKWIVGAQLDRSIAFNGYMFFVLPLSVRYVEDGEANTLSWCLSKARRKLTQG